MPKQKKQKGKSKKNKNTKRQPSPKPKNKKNNDKDNVITNLTAKEKKRQKKSKKKQIEEEFKEELNKLGYYIREVDGDGNCLFRSVCDQLENNEKNHKYYREKTVEFMRANMEKFKPFIEDDQTIEEYIDNMAKNKEWGGNLEIYAMSMALHVNFYIYIYQHPIYIVKNFDDPKQNIMLTYHDGKHYNSLRKLNDGMEKEEKKKKEKDNESGSEDSSDSENANLNDVKGLIDKVEHLNI